MLATSDPCAKGREAPRSAAVWGAAHAGAGKIVQKAVGSYAREARREITRRKQLGS